MPYKRCDPVSEEAVSTNKWIGSTTVFEKFREIWQIGNTLGNEEIKDTARLAFAMAFRMHRKLLENEEYRLSGEHIDFIRKEDSYGLADELDMKKSRWIGHFQVCEKSREIWRIGRELKNKELMLKAREAMFMTKRMNEQLKAYKAIREEVYEQGGHTDAIR